MESDSRQTVRKESLKFWKVTMKSRSDLGFAQRIIGGIRKALEGTNTSSSGYYKDDTQLSNRTAGHGCTSVIAHNY